MEKHWFENEWKKQLNLKTTFIWICWTTKSTVAKHLFFLSLSDYTSTCIEKERKKEEKEEPLSFFWWRKNPGKKLTHLKEEARKKKKKARCNYTHLQFSLPEILLFFFPENHSPTKREIPENHSPTKREIPENRSPTKREIPEKNTNGH